MKAVILYLHLSSVMSECNLQCDVLFYSNQSSECFYCSILCLFYYCHGNNKINEDNFIILKLSSSGTEIHGW